MRSILRNCNFFAPLVLAVALLVPAAAFGQSVAQPNSWTVTPFLGGGFGVSDEGGGSMGIGVAVGYDYTSNIGFEGELGYLFDLAGDSDLIDWSLTNVSGNFLYHFDVKNNITPYATFGLGFERSSIDADDATALVIPSSTEVSFNFGGGVKYPLTERLLIRGDLRRFQSNDLAPDFWRLYAGITVNLAR